MMTDMNNAVDEFVDAINKVLGYPQWTGFHPADTKKNNEKLKADASMYYWDHGTLRKRIIYSISIIDTTELEWKDMDSLRRLLKRSNLPRFVYDVKFWYSDKHVLMVQTSNKGQWSTGTMYYWSNIDDWTFHQELRELKMNEKIDRALADIAYARKQLDSISDKFKTMRKTVLI
jgi:hypothetical protein